MINSIIGAVVGALTSLIVLAALTTANALTIPTGHVITSDGEVVHATESENTQKQVDINGHAIVAGQVVVQGDEGLVSITIDEAREILRNGGVEGLSVEVQEALADLSDDDLAAIDQAIRDGDLTVEQLEKGVAAFGAECINAENSCGITEEQLDAAGL